MLWKVIINGKDSGIVESNEQWARPYWREQARLRGCRIQLVRYV